MQAIHDSIISTLQDDTTLGFNELRLNEEAAPLYKENPQLKNTVELFCFGDYTHYVQHKERYIELSHGAVNKLKQLTLASEALKSNRLNYADLQKKLEFSSSLELEIFLAETISAKVIDATLSGKERLVRVKSSRGRDVIVAGEDLDERKRLEEEYGAKSVDYLVEMLRKFGEKVDKAFEYIKKVSEGDDKEAGEESTKAAPTNEDKAKKDKEEVTEDEDTKMTGDTSSSTDPGITIAASSAGPSGVDVPASQEQGPSSGGSSDPVSRKRKIDGK